MSFFFRKIIPVTASDEGDGPGLETSRTVFVGKLPSPNNLLRKAETLQEILEADLLACDAKWALFVTAALSYRFEKQLKPFPPRFVSEQKGLDIDTLVDVIHETPKLEYLLHRIKNRRCHEVDPRAIHLVHWVLVDQKEHGLRLVQEQEVYNWFLITNLKDIKQPSHIFVVCDTNEKGKTRNGDIEMFTELAFYGNKLDCFYSILHNGFPSDEPILLTKNLVASMEHSPIGAAWGASSCGSLISCVALCEYFNNPDYVEKKYMSLADSDSKYEAMEVHKADLVNVRYLLFYGTHFSHHDPEESKMVGWFQRNKSTLTVVTYCFALAIIGFVNRDNGRFVKEFLARKLQTIVNFSNNIMFRK